MRVMHFGIGGYDDTVFSPLAGLRNLGHEVKTCSIFRLPEIRRKVEYAIQEFMPDIVVTIGRWHCDFDAEILWDIINKYQLLHIYWAIEDPTFFDSISILHLRAYDFVFTTSEECIKKYYDLGVPAAYLPFACNPEVHKRTLPIEKYKNDIVVLSNNYGYFDIEPYSFRYKCYRELIDPLLQRDYDLKIYGRGWNDEKLAIPHKHIAGYVHRSKVPLIYSSAKIALPIQWDYTGHICYKTYEALGCRCMQIAPYTPLQEKYFKHGEHIIYSNSAEETIRYVDYYLSHDDEREMVATGGQEEVRRNHNCTLRAAEILKALEHYIFK